jgi:hypothetical protein
MVGLGHTPSVQQVARLQHTHPRPGLAGNAWAKDLFAQLATRRGRSAVCCGRLAQDAAVALHVVHGDWQIFRYLLVTGGLIWLFPNH